MFQRLIEARLRGARLAANDLVDGIDDRSKLFLVELADEQQRLVGLVLAAFAALVVTILAIVWGAATVVAFAWDTPWRTTALLGLASFWIIFAIALAMKAKSLLSASRGAFAFTRKVAAEDFERLREALKP